MGSVYLVEDQRVFGKKYALKEMLNTLTNPAERDLALQQFEREASILATLKHPNLPDIIDYFSEHGRQYLVMEFVEGETLEQHLANQQSFLSEDLVIDWALQLCDVLEYLHTRVPPIVFRDLKPSNIMLDADGRVKLIDFGIARMFQPGKAHDSVQMGTRGYAAPEQYGTRQSDARSDIYGLGATLHHLLTKLDPSRFSFNLPPVRSINPNISEALEQIIAKALQLDPAQRWQSASEMKQALIDIRARAVVSQPSPPPLMPSPAGASPAHPLPGPITALSLDTHFLDFGSVLPGRRRWQSLTITNRQQATLKIEISCDQPWIGIEPTSLRLRPGERRRVTVSVSTASLSVDSGLQEQGCIILSSNGAQTSIKVGVKVESVPLIRQAAVLLANLAMGAICGLLILGVLPILSLRLIGIESNHLSWIYVLYGIVVGSSIFALIGRRIQDMVNFALALATGALIFSVVGALWGICVGFLADLIIGNYGIWKIGTGIGILAGTVVGVYYVWNAPGRWGIWPF